MLDVLIEQDFGLREVLGTMCPLCAAEEPSYLK
jgi:hypothetical protein